MLPKLALLPIVILFVVISPLAKITFTNALASPTVIPSTEMKGLFAIYQITLNWEVHTVVLLLAGVTCNAILLPDMLTDNEPVDPPKLTVAKVE